MSATHTPVRPLTTRQSVGGPWATSFAIWFVLLLPALLLSAFQEIGVPYPNLLIGGLACLGQCAASALIFMIARLSRRSARPIPLALCLLFWIAVGAAHGLTAGYLAWVFAGADPHYVVRTGFWSISALIWLPLTTYAMAQFENRRNLLVTLQGALAREADSRRDSIAEIARLRSTIVGAIQENIRPVLVEIAGSLQSIGPALDAARLAELGERLASVSEETSRIIESTAQPQPVRKSKSAASVSTPLTAALDFDHARPVMTALLTSVALLPLTVAISFGSMDLQPVGLGSTALILVVITVLLLAGLAAQGFARGLSPRARIAWTLIAYLVAGIAAAVAAALGPWQPKDQQNLILALLLPIAVPLGATALSAAVGLGNANLALVGQIDSIEFDRASLEAELEHQRRDIRDQVAAVTHGPLRGRLAACAMALNFHAAEIGSSTPARTEYITTNVLEHLEDAMRELDTLG